MVSAALFLKPSGEKHHLWSRQTYGLSTSENIYTLRNAIPHMTPTNFPSLMRIGKMHIYEKRPAGGTCSPINPQRLTWLLLKHGGLTRRAYLYTT